MGAGTMQSPARGDEAIRLHHARLRLTPLAFTIAGQLTEIPRQREKLVPQPQEALASGFLTLNAAPIRSSTKSISAPAM